MESHNPSYYLRSNTKFIRIYNFSTISINSDLDIPSGVLQSTTTEIGLLNLYDSSIQLTNKE